MKILIAGGSGLIGTRLSERLVAAGHEVAHLSRQVAAGRYRVYQWNLAAGTIDPAALGWADAIVNLAGANVAAGRWTAAHKRAMLESRTQSAHLLRDALARLLSHGVRVYVSAAGTGLYGDTADRIVDETTAPPPPGRDFLAEVSQAWEQAAAALATVGPREVRLRLGVVLTQRGGALPKLALPVRLGLGAPLGSGRQWVSWVHLDDACRAFELALTDQRLTGAYNVVAPEAVTNAGLTRAIAQVLHRPLWLPAVPAFALRLALGEMAATVLTSQRVTPRRLTAEVGFTFEAPTLAEALRREYA